MRAWIGVMLVFSLGACVQEEPQSVAPLYDTARQSGLSSFLIFRCRNFVLHAFVENSDTGINESRWLFIF